MQLLSYYMSPVGLLRLKEEDGFLIELSGVDSTDVGMAETTESPLLNEVKKQLDEYFEGKRSQFDLPLRQKGTPFQMKAWEYLKNIPYGQTVSYKEEAAEVGNAKAVRAIGSANGCNNIAIIVPCHRVINSNGKLGGYAYGLPMKEKLLQLEKDFAVNF